MTPREVSLSLTQALLHTQTEAHAGGHPARGRRPAPSIAISREAGARGRSVARALGQKLGWQVYDSELVDKVAEEMRQSPGHLESVDERRTSWLEELLTNLLGTARVHSDAYLKYLIATVRGLGAVGHAVVVGRGAHCILGPESTLLVRLVADHKDRVHNIMRELGLSEADADAWVDRKGKERTRFVRDVFSKDPAEPHQYDLVLNMSRLSVEEAADLIADLARRRDR
jgi:cytidylate kinase